MQAIALLNGNGALRAEALGDISKIRLEKVKLALQQVCKRGLGPCLQWAQLFWGDEEGEDQSAALSSFYKSGLA